MNFAHPLAILLAIPAILAVVYFAPRSFLRVPQKRKVQRLTLRSRLGISNLLGAIGSALSPANLPRTILCGALFSLAVALTGVTARQLAPSTDITTQGRAIILALDNSISMKEPFDGQLPQLKYRSPFFEESNDVVPNPSQMPQRRIDAGLTVILRFVEHRMDKPTSGIDETALMTFAQRPRLCWPLDTSLTQIRRHGSFVPRTSRGDGLEGGTNFGREIPGPIDAAAEEFKHAKSTQRVLVLITDGEDKIDETVRTRLKSVLAEARVARFYVIGIGPKLKDENADIQQLCREVNGKVFHADDASQLDRCMNEIDNLESAPVTVAVPISEAPMFWLPLSIALMLAGSWAFIEAVLHGR